MANSDKKRPVVLLIAEDVREEKCTGFYDKLSNSWSDRDYAFASTKKHNEDM